MRRLLALSAAAVLAVGVSASAVPTLPVSPVVPAVPGAVQTSPNVKHIGTIPIEGVGVSLALVRVNKRVRAFVSGAAGLSIYDATNPKAPLLLGHLPVYNWENESIAVTPDGRYAFLTEFTAGLYLHAVDVSDPTNPQIVGTIPGGPHTVACADPKCTYLFGSEGQTFDVLDPTAMVQLPKARSWGALTGARSGHALHKDARGVWISDTSPLVAFVLNPDPLHLKVLTTGTITKDTQYQHNNVRPRADKYRPRKAGEGLGGPLRDGELLLGNGETNFTGTCDGAGGAFSTWSMVGFERGVPMKQLHVLRPVTNGAFTSDPAVNAMGCSGHWFTEKTGRDGKILVAASWYEHGTRFLSVDPRNGRISQVGYFQANRGASSSSYWFPHSDVVWSVDYHSGIDILEFDQSPAKRPTARAIEASWLSKLDTDPFAQAIRELCRSGAKATVEQHARLHAL